MAEQPKRTEFPVFTAVAAAYFENEQKLSGKIIKEQVTKPNLTTIGRENAIEKVEKYYSVEGVKKENAQISQVQFMGKTLQEFEKMDISPLPIDILPKNISYPKDLATEDGSPIGKAEVTIYPKNKIPKLPNVPEGKTVIFYEDGVPPNIMSIGKIKKELHSNIQVLEDLARKFDNSDLPHLKLTNKGKLTPLGSEMAELLLRNEALSQKLTRRENEVTLQHDPQDPTATGNLQQPKQKVLTPEQRIREIFKDGKSAMLDLPQLNVGQFADANHQMGTPAPKLAGITGANGLQQS